MKFANILENNQETFYKNKIEIMSQQFELTKKNQ